MHYSRITHIRKPDRYSSHEHITHVGNLIEGWVITREDAIARIDSKRNTFYVVDAKDPKKRSDVGVIRPIGRDPYLRTYADGDWNDNLLALPGC